jgi:hypothetical protein
MIGLFATRWRGAIIGGATILAASINCVSSPRVFAQAVPDYAAFMAAPDRSEADRTADSEGTRYRSSPSPDYVRA